MGQRLERCACKPRDIGVAHSHQKLEKLGRGIGPTLLTPCYQTTGFQNCETIYFSYLQPLIYKCLCYKCL